MSRSDKIYSATYSNVPVYEYNVDGNHVMRRRSDDWINATHILKVADYDKPARTRILEREVQKGVHEKVQGGYGKYQGTWIPLADGKELAAKNGVLEKLLPIFEFVPGDRSPPPAPKHATASSKPRARGPAQNKRQPVYSQPQDYDQMDISIQGGETPDRDAFSESAFDEYDQSQFTNPRKRRKIEEHLSQADKEHQLWADELLDYFMLQDSPYDSLPVAPIPPVNADLNRPIDDKGHTALHWAAAMGDLEVVKDLIRRGARIDVQSKNGETPLMRAVVFTNNYDRQNMERLAGLLIQTVNMQEWYGSTVFHHIANTTERKSKYQCARYYLDCILNKMTEILSPDQIERVLNETDQNGDTAILIAARNGARKCVRSLICRNADSSIVNTAGENAEQFIIELNNRRKEREHHSRQLSSSPFQGNGGGLALGGPVQSHLKGIQASSNSLALLSQNTTNGLINDSGTQEDYKSEIALAMKTSVIPAVLDKFQALINNVETELVEKDAELAEAERVVARRNTELEQLKAQLDEVRAKDLEQTNGTLEDNDLLSAELDTLMAECGTLTMNEQNSLLAEILERERLHANQIAPGGGDVNGVSEANADGSVEEKIRLANDLQALAQLRQELVNTIVQNLSVAGYGNKQAEYKRLITGALRVPEEEVEEALPGIVAELETSYDLEHVGA